MVSGSTTKQYIMYVCILVVVDVDVVVSAPCWV